MRTGIRLLSLAGALALTAAIPATAAADGLSTSSCEPAAPYKHVIYIQYDNTHLTRDNLSVPSDLEQVPALKDFLADNGSLSSDNHTPLIAHTAGDIITTLTGLYPDRNGIGVSNSYLQYAPNSGQLQTGPPPRFSFFSPTAFPYWTDPVSSSSIPSPGDPFPNLITDGQKNTPAPWVPYTRAGCDVGAFSIADMELENTGPDIASAFGANSPQLTFTSRSTNSAGRALSAADFEGIAIHCSQADSVAASGPHHGLCSPGNGGVADKLPDEPFGYSGFNALFGGIYANQVTSTPGSFVSSGQDMAGVQNGDINDLAAPVHDVYAYSSRGCQFCANGKNTGYNGQLISTAIIGDGTNSGFVSGFSPTPAQTLGHVASMQEAGVPVTFAYIEDAHNNWNPPFQALGPGQARYTDQLRQENQAFQAFFERLQADKINSSNTLFVFTADEGDHFAGVAPTNPGCDGQTAATVCTYPTNGIGEQDAQIGDALARENQGVTQPAFDIHFDDAPNFYVHGTSAPPGPNDASVRLLEHELATLTLQNQQTGATDQVTSHIADDVDQSILHMTTTDPLRTPTFTDFANPTYFYQTFRCPQTSTPGCPVVGPGFAWNHGGDQLEVDTTWVGYVGPTVAHLGQTNDIWTDHTDTRPTMLSLLGLQDDYVQDGAATTQVMDPSAIPADLKDHVGQYERLTAAYKQLDAAVGQFGHDSEIVSTTATESRSPGDAVYQGFDQQLAACEAARDAVADNIRSAINNAVFGGVGIQHAKLGLLEQQAATLIDDMHLLSQMSTPPSSPVCGNVQGPT